MGSFYVAIRGTVRLEKIERVKFQRGGKMGAALNTNLIRAVCQGCLFFSQMHSEGEGKLVEFKLQTSKEKQSGPGDIALVFSMIRCMHFYFHE